MKERNFWNYAVVGASVAGIYGCYLRQGVVQEGIYRYKYDGGKRFHNPSFLVACTCTIGAVVGLVGMFLTMYIKSTDSVVLQSIRATFNIGQPKPQDPKDKSPLFATEQQGEVIPTSESLTNLRGEPPAPAHVDVEKRLATVVCGGGPSQSESGVLVQGSLVGLTYVLSMMATNFALTSVNYPTQVLVKSGKCIPVILGGVLIFGKRYHYSDYMTVACVTISLIMFQCFSNEKHKDTKATAWGFGALMFSLVMDGMTGPRQDKMVEQYKISTFDLMFLINITSLPLAWAFSAVLDSAEPFHIMRHDPSFIWRIVQYCVYGSIGQIFIVKILMELGALYLTLITTVRKFLGIVGSVIIYRTPIAPLQWVSIVLLFSSGFFKYIFKKKPVDAGGLAAANAAGIPEAKEMELPFKNAAGTTAPTASTTPATTPPSSTK